MTNIDRVRARLDEAFLFEQSIDIDVYDRRREAASGVSRCSAWTDMRSEIDALDVEGILAFAERILPRAADLWVQSSLDQRQRFLLSRGNLVRRKTVCWNRRSRQRLQLLPEIGD